MRRESIIILFKLSHFNDGDYWMCFSSEIEHGFSFVNICQVPRELLKTDALFA